MKKYLLLTPLAILFAVTSIYLFQQKVASNTSNSLPSELTRLEARNLVNSPIDNYAAQAKPNVKVLAAVGKGDGRSVIIDNFLAKHNSPMTGLGQVFVQAADQYGLDYRLLPAIAFQESTLGKRMPKNSHNAWGWAIYTGETSGAKFRNWEHAIFTVAKGLKTDYIDRGLRTTEAIMTRYSDSEGEWAFGVNFAMEAMATN